MYKTSEGNGIIRTEDGAFIPFAEDNIDYIEYQKWLTEGNAPQPTHTDEELLAIAKATKLAEIYGAFCEDRDGITWVTQIDGTVYGYDRKSEDITNFMAGMKRAELIGFTDYKVYIDNLETKSMIAHTPEMFYVCLKQSAQEQLSAYDKFIEARALLNLPDIIISEVEAVSY